MGMPRSWAVCHLLGHRFLLVSDYIRTRKIGVIVLRGSGSFWRVSWLRTLSASVGDSSRFRRKESFSLVYER